MWRRYRAGRADRECVPRRPRRIRRGKSRWVSRRRARSNWRSRRSRTSSTPDASPYPVLPPWHSRPKPLMRGPRAALSPGRAGFPRRLQYDVHEAPAPRPAGFKEGRSVADTIRIVDYYYIEAPNKPGEGARMLRHLGDAGVNLALLHAFPSGRRTQVDFVSTDAAALKRAARPAKWKLVGPKKAILVNGDDRVGALTGIAAGAGRFGAVIWVDPRNVRRAAQLLGASS